MILNKAGCFAQWRLYSSSQHVGSRGTTLVISLPACMLCSALLMPGQSRNLFARWSCDLALGRPNQTSGDATPLATAACANCLLVGHLAGAVPEAGCLCYTCPARTWRLCAVLKGGAIFLVAVMHSFKRTPTAQFLNQHTSTGAHTTVTQHHSQQLHPAQPSRQARNKNQMQCGPNVGHKQLGNSCREPVNFLYQRWYNYLRLGFCSKEMGDWSVNRPGRYRTQGSTRCHEQPRHARDTKEINERSRASCDTSRAPVLLTTSTHTQCVQPGSSGHVVGLCARGLQLPTSDRQIAIPAGMHAAECRASRSQTRQEAAPLGPRAASAAGELSPQLLQRRHNLLLLTPHHSGSCLLLCAEHTQVLQTYSRDTGHDCPCEPLQANTTCALLTAWLQGSGCGKCDKDSFMLSAVAWLCCAPTARRINSVRNSPRIAPLLGPGTVPPSSPRKPGAAPRLRWAVHASCACACGLQGGSSGMLRQLSCCQHNDLSCPTCSLQAACRSLS